MYSRFEKELKKKGISVNQFCKEVGIGNATISDWKNGKSIPKIDKLEKIADYFGITLDYLKTGEEKRFSTDNATLIKEIRNDDELTEMLKIYFSLS